MVSPKPKRLSLNMKLLMADLRRVPGRGLDVYGGEISTARALERRGLVRTRNIGVSQRVRLTDAGQQWLGEN